MKTYKYIKTYKRHVLGLRRRIVRRVKAVVLRSRLSRSVRKYLKMEAHIALRRAALFSHKQIKVRPRFMLALKAIFALIVLLGVSTHISNVLDEKKDEIKVQGQAVLVAEASSPGEQMTEIVSVVDAKLSPFAYVEPVDDGMVSQGFSSYHRAIDIATSLGSPIRPIGKGVVEFAGFSPDGKGNIVIVNHGDGLKTVYAHMGKIEVAVGNNVDTSTTLGNVGLTGRTTGAHLHLEVYDREASMNPVSVLP